MTYYDDDYDDDLFDEDLDEEDLEEDDLYDEDEEEDDFDDDEDELYDADEYREELLDLIHETVEDEGANAVMSLIRSTDDTLEYSDTLTLSPITSISGYYYYLTFISGEMEDEIVQIFTEKLLNNNQSILSL